MSELSQAALDLYPMAHLYAALGSQASTIWIFSAAMAGMAIFTAAMKGSSSGLDARTVLSAMAICIPAVALMEARSAFERAQIYDTPSTVLGSVQASDVLAGGCSTALTNVQLSGAQGALTLPGRFAVLPGDSLVKKVVEDRTYVCVAETDRCTRAI